MKPFARHFLATLLPLALLVGVASASRVAPVSKPFEVADHAGLFSPSVVQKANADIADLKKLHSFDLCVETFKEVPEERREKFLQVLGDDKARAQFYDRWAVDNAKAHNLSGIYLLVVAEHRYDDKLAPPHAEILLHPGNHPLFTPADRETLWERFKARFKKSQDNALEDSVQFVRERVNEHAQSAPGQAQQPQPGDGGPAGPVAEPRSGSLSFLGGLGGCLCIGLVAVLGVWLVIGLVRTFTGMGRPAGYGGAQGGPGGYGPGYGGGGYGGGGGGGGFLSSLFGGMLGAGAGMWMYDNFFGHHTPSAGAGGGFGTGDYYGGRGHDGGNPGVGADDGGYSRSGGDLDGGGSAGTGGDLDTGGGGGDYGDSGDTGGGGGDFGGGGDVGGGGDFGGGGGDFGGGGDLGGGGGDFGGGGDVGGGGDF